MTEYDDINRLLNEAARRINEKMRNSPGFFTVGMSSNYERGVVLDFVKGRDGVWRMQPDR